MQDYEWGIITSANYPGELVVRVGKYLYLLAAADRFADIATADVMVAPVPKGTKYQLEF